MNRQDDKTQKELCEKIIKYLYGKSTDVEQYKVFHTRYDDVDICDLRGIDITQFDFTTPKMINRHEIQYDKKIKKALITVGFTIHGEGAWWRDVDDSTYKAVFDTRVGRNHSVDKTVLAIYKKS